ncbi:MAG TPA: hypothetical protein VFV68_05975 [Agriterribacter sp.]|nr:hypothetical protein [Agriterribacter sp.]
MKKFLAAILAVLYMGTSTGAAFTMHYCMGKTAGWELGHGKGNVCHKCGMEKSVKKDKDCCKDEHKMLKSDVDQKTAESAFQFMQAASLAASASFFQSVVVDISSITEKNPISNAPPNKTGVAVYLRNCVFLI